LYSEDIPSITADAKATLYVTLSEIKDVFKYQTDSNDVVNVDATDIKYYTYDTAWPELNPANAVVTDQPIASSNAAGPFPSNKLFVSHDFIRHLADDLFGTHLGVDLFNNELELLQDIRSICGDAASGNTWYDIKAAVKKVSINSDATGFDGLAGDAGELYMTNANATAENLCRVLMAQMIDSEPARFASIEASELPQSLPFETGDVISFKLTINPAEGQKLLTKEEGDSDVPPRSYEIRLEIVADDDTTKVNLEPADDEASP
jgi:hypothetical protein